MLFRTSKPLAIIPPDVGIRPGRNVAAASAIPKQSGPLIQVYRAIDARAAIFAAYDVDSHLVILPLEKFKPFFMGRTFGIPVWTVTAAN